MKVESLIQPKMVKISKCTIQIFVHRLVVIEGRLKQDPSTEQSFSAIYCIHLM